MKILVSWLRELVDVPVTPAKLASDLHMAGFEVASVEPPPGAPDTGDDAVIDLEITANRPDCLSVHRHRPRGRDAVRHAAADAARSRRSAPPTRRAPAICGSRSRTPRAAPATAARSPKCSIAPVARVDAAAARRRRRPRRSTTSSTSRTTCCSSSGTRCTRSISSGSAGRELRIRTARPGERITTLDGQDRALAPDMLVIADADAAAGDRRRHGRRRQRGLGTRRASIALESAWFEPTGIRRTSKRLGLSTEASYRFERGADIEAPPVGAGARLRAAANRPVPAARCLVGSTRIPRRASAGCAARHGTRRPGARRRRAQSPRSPGRSRAWRSLWCRRRRPRTGSAPRAGRRAWHRSHRCHCPVVADRRRARHRPDRGDRAPLRVRPPAHDLPDARADARRTRSAVSSATGWCGVSRRRPGSPKRVTFSFIERAAALPFAAGAGPGRNPESTVGAVRRAAAVAAARRDRGRRPQPPPRSGRRAAVRGWARSSPTTAGNGARWRSRGSARAHPRTGAAAAGRSTSST